MCATMPKLQYGTSRAASHALDREQLEQAYELMHTALEEIIEGGPWRCINRAEEALEDLWEVVKEANGG